MCLCAGELQVVPVAVKAEAVENVCVSWCCYYEGKLLKAVPGCCYAVKEDRLMLWTCRCCCDVDKQASCYKQS